jgi:hypothetical protein
MNPEKEQAYAALSAAADVIKTIACIQAKIACGIFDGGHGRIYNETDAKREIKYLRLVAISFYNDLFSIGAAGSSYKEAANIARRQLPVAAHGNHR